MSERQENEVTTFDDGMSAEKARYAGKTAKRLFSKLLEQKGKLIVVLISVVFSCAFTLAAPMVIGQAINQIFDSVRHSLETGAAFTMNFSAMGQILGLLLCLYVFSAAFNYLQQYLMASVSQKLTLSLRESLSAKLARMPLSYFDSHKKGDILSRATNDLEKVADTLQEGLMQFIITIVTIIGAVTLMLVISPLLTLIAFVMIIVGMVITALVARRSQHCFARNQKTLGELNGHIEEFFTGQVVIKAFNREDASTQTVEEVNERLYAASRNAQFITFAVNPLIRLMNQIGYVLIAVMGAFFVIQGRLSLGVIQAFFQYVNQASEPITEAAYIFNSMQAAIASAERVFEVLDEEDEVPDISPAKALTEPKGDVRFEHVRFGYSPNRLLMKDISIDVKAGEKIAVVGPTGAGKTTLINLLMRFYELDGGRILIDNIDIRDLRRGDLRSQFGMVLQDTWLFGGTIEDNIAYGRKAATREEIVHAAKAARADHFIRTLPQGYQTILNDEASNISQGQRQLLTIARAILADPAILILDEATSSVDTRTELEIQKAMDHLMKGRTSFVIAHRLSTIIDADHILVMKNGTIVEQGTHLGLLAQNGFYADLYNSQFTVKVS
ncbi:ABC transporter ATP-binding protein [Eubacterium maltosivorans]|uniref:ABC transporter ATP-binding protein n=1 Tax=Eubacterium maltosivorans TaxID=2041044 RepID=A0A4P9C863_EUBML|nr:ABC transporter ATP-binding protein [Eubacterium maltosivorans]QCT71680.1 ABC transporter ATP-binding protein [Eubacterium maltosivorans]